MKKIIIFLILGFVCHESGDSREYNIHEVSEISLIKHCIDIWKSDSCGCDRKRSIEMADKIIEYYNLVGQPVDSLLKYLGYGNDGIMYYDINSNKTDEGTEYDENSSFLVLSFNQYGLLVDFKEVKYENETY